MFFHIFLFELRYWLRQPIAYIFLLINALLVFGATCSDDITIGGSTGNVHKNAPYVVEFFFANLTLICLLMITAFFNSAAARDFSEKTSQIFFTTPMKKRDYLLGRFAGALVISIIPFLGVSLGSILGSMMPGSMPNGLDQRTGLPIWRDFPFLCCPTCFLPARSYSVSQHLRAVP